MRPTVSFLLFLSLSAGPLSAQTWAPVGSGTSSTVYALEPFDGQLYVGGLFTEIGGVSTNYLARWDGTVWSTIGNLTGYMAGDHLYANDTALFIGDGGSVRYWNGGPIQYLTGSPSSSFNSSVFCFAEYDDTLYVGGFFTTPFAHIARWNGSSYEGLTTGTGAQVSTLGPYDGQLFVGGNFFAAGDTVSHHTALWNGSAWNSMGVGVNHFVYTHCIFQDTLYIGGLFTQANGLPASRVAKWNGSQWVKVGGTLNDYVTTMAVYHDQLYIGGAFTTPSRIARLSGSSWVAVGSGCNNTVKTMDVFHDSLFVGGLFTMAGGEPASRIAKWHLPAAPVATFSAATPTLCPNQCTTFTDNSPNGVSSWAWSFPGGVPATSTDSMPTVCYATPGTYSVSLTATNAGGTDSHTDTAAVLVEICTGLHDIAVGTLFSVRPNPAHGIIEIRCPPWETASVTTISLIDGTGRVVVQQAFTGGALEVDVSELPAGLYLVSMESAANRELVRLVID